MKLGNVHDVHGQRARRQRGRRRRRHHRHPQPRPAADRRHADRRRGARVQGHSVLRAGAVPRRAAARSVQGQAAGRKACASWARKARSRCSRRSSATTLLLGAVGQLQFEVVAARLASEYKVDAVYDDARIVDRALAHAIPTTSDAARLRARPRGDAGAPTSTAIPCISRRTASTCRWRWSAGRRSASTRRASTARSCDAATNAVTRHLTL